MTAYVFSVSGRDGARGADGYDYAGTRASLGMDGRSGGHGRAGEDGVRAGNISLQISAPQTTTHLPENVVLPQPADIDVVLDGQLAKPGGGKDTLSTPLCVDGAKDIFLNAKGGDGGRGGDGGDGQQGGNGIPGADATRYSAGENGGPGGDGGDGGNAGRGGSGAPGGNIRLSVPKDDTYLVMLCHRHDVSGGTGGSAGTPGDGGSPGYGGPGGSSYSWTTTHYGYRETTTIRHTNPGGSPGQPGYPGHRGQYAMAGADGPDGLFTIIVQDFDRDTNTGYESCFDLKLMDVKIAPEKGDGIIEPGCRVLVTFITVRNVGGMPTPTSRSILVYIRPEPEAPPNLAGNNWVVSEGFQRWVQLPRALEPDIDATISCTARALDPESGHLGFRIAPVDPVAAFALLPDRHQRGEAFHVRSSLLLRAQMTPLGRDFSVFLNPFPFVITYPVQMSEPACLPCLPPGEDGLLRFNVSNISLQSYGRDGEMKRLVVIRIANDGGDVDPNDLEFTPIINGSPAEAVVFTRTAPNSPLQFHGGQFTQGITVLPVNTALEISGRLKFSNHVVPYTMAKLSVDLLLGEIDHPDNVISIQHRDLTLRVSKRYNKTPNSLFLLVTNQQTTSAELEAWERMYAMVFGHKSGGSLATVWDISQEGRFNLNRVLRTGRTLCDDWENSTVVILNNAFDNLATRNNVERDEFALNYVSSDQLASAAIGRGLHFCIVAPLDEKSGAQGRYLSNPQRGIDFTGSNAFDPLHGLLNTFSLMPSSYIVYGSVKDFRAAEVDRHANGTTIKRWQAPWSKKPANPVVLGHYSSTPGLYTHAEHVVLVKCSTPFKSLRKVTKQAKMLEKRLLRLHPNRRYVMTTCNADDLRMWANQMQFVWPPHTQAVIRIRRLLDVSSVTSRITLAGAPTSPVDPRALRPGAATIHTPNFIHSPQIAAAVVSSIPFHRRVNLYASALVALSSFPSAEETWRADMFKASILADLACEQAVLRMRRRSRGLTSESVTTLLARLAVLSKIELPQSARDSLIGVHLIDLLAKFTAYMETQVAWYEKLLPGRRSRQVTKASTSFINHLISRVFVDEVATKKALKTATAQILKSWKLDVKKMRKSLAKTKPKPTVTLKGCGFAKALQAGCVAGGKVDWCEDPAAASSPTSASGSVCTEFAMLFTPESFVASAPPATAPHRRMGSLGTICQHEDVMQIENSGIEKRASIRRKVTLNRRLTRDLSSGGPGTDIAEEDEDEDVLAGLPTLGQTAPA